MIDKIVDVFTFTFILFYGLSCAVSMIHLT